MPIKRLLRKMHLNLVVIPLKAPNLLIIYIVPLFGFILAIQLFIDGNRPILELSQMDSNIGELIYVSPPSKKESSTIRLKLDDGSIKTYKTNIYFEDSLDQFLSKPLKVWSKEELSITRFGFKTQIYQVESGKKILFDYSNVRRSMEASRKSFIKFSYVIPLFLIFFPFWALWNASENIKARN